MSFNANAYTFLKLSITIIQGIYLVPIARPGQMDSLSFGMSKQYNTTYRKQLHIECPLEQKKIADAIECEFHSADLSLPCITKGFFVTCLQTWKFKAKSSLISTLERSLYILSMSNLDGTPRLWAVRATHY